MNFRERMANLMKNGVKLNVINQLMLLFSIALGVGMIYAAYQTDDSYQAMIKTTEKFVAVQRSMGMLEENAGAMADACSQFLSTGDMQAVFRYAGQMEAIAEAERQMAENIEPTDAQIAAQKTAGEMRRLECRAMRLMAEGMEKELSVFPDLIRQIELSPEEQALSPAEKQAAARELIAGAEYSAARLRLTENVDNCHREISEETQVSTGQSAAALTRLSSRQKKLIVLFIAAAFVTVGVNSALVIRPLKRCIDHLDSQTVVPVRGAFEMRRLARVYNDVMEENRIKNEALSYSASHDPLTGLFNRAGYDQAYEQLKQEEIGLLVVDVDSFKKYNDVYGHDMGDRVLKRVAQILRASFRSNDHISRIGGDEFCVILQGAGRDQGNLVIQKVGVINAYLAEVEDDLPPITLSVGAAFWNRKNPSGDLFKDADTALYRVKKRGKGGCEVY